MIKYIKKGNIFESNCEALVNPVNTVGVMGAGLAKQFKKRYPKNFVAYQDYCNQGKLKPGGVFVFLEEGDIIVNLATKDHWKDPSEVDYVEKGLQQLLQFIQIQEVVSVAIPALGCGLGGLDWADNVLPLIEYYFQDNEEVSNVEAKVYVPYGY
jgi:O-acetyl-ADP-ribose deacetylase (regulator of RNase III)